MCQTGHFPSLKCLFPILLPLLLNERIAHRRKIHVMESSIMNGNIIIFLIYLNFQHVNANKSNTMKLTAQASMRSDDHTEANESLLLNESCVSQNTSCLMTPTAVGSKSVTKADSAKSPTLKSVGDDLWLDFVLSEEDGNGQAAEEKEDHGCDEDDIISLDFFPPISGPWPAYFQLSQSTSKKSKKGLNVATASTLSLRSSSSRKTADGGRGRQSFGGFMWVFIILLGSKLGR